MRSTCEEGASAFLGLGEREAGRIHVLRGEGSGRPLPAGRAGPAGGGPADSSGFLRFRRSEQDRGTREGRSGSRALGATFKYTELILPTRAAQGFEGAGFLLVVVSAPSHTTFPGIFWAKRKYSSVVSVVFCKIGTWKNMCVCCLLPSLLLVRVRVWGVWLQDVRVTSGETQQSSGIFRPFLLGLGAPRSCLPGVTADRALKRPFPQSRGLGVCGRSQRRRRRPGRPPFPGR